jgi:hypothetical protein
MHGDLGRNPVCSKLCSEKHRLSVTQADSHRQGRKNEPPQHSEGNAPRRQSNRRQFRIGTQQQSRWRGERVATVLYQAMCVHKCVKHWQRLVARVSSSFGCDSLVVHHSWCSLGIEHSRFYKNTLICVKQCVVTRPWSTGSGLLQGCVHRLKCNPMVMLHMKCTHVGWLLHFSFSFHANFDC